MSKLYYLEQVIIEMSDLLIDIAVFKKQARDHGVNETYNRLERRLKSFESLIGPLPEYIEKNSAMGFWFYISEKYDSYHKRSNHIREDFRDKYLDIVKEIPENKLSLKEALLDRDILLEEQIGQGGFGTVYKGTQMVLDEPRAIKVLDPSPFFDESDNRYLVRFAREASIISKLKHNNIVRFYDAGVASGEPFLITEYLSHGNLNDLTSNHGKFPESHVLGVLADILSGLVYAHNLNVYHRDIKPSNIMLMDGVYKIVDFGGSKAITKALSSRITTKAMGTSGYVSPELLDDPRLLHPGIDIYSIGMTATYLLANQVPHSGAISTVLKNNDVSDSFIEVIAKATCPIEERYQTAQEMLNDLAKFNQSAQKK